MRLVRDENALAHQYSATMCHWQWDDISSLSAVDSMPPITPLAIVLATSLLRPTIAALVHANANLPVLYLQSSLCTQSLTVTLQCCTNLSAYFSIRWLSYFAASYLLIHLCALFTSTDVSAGDTVCLFVSLIAVYRANWHS